MTLNIDNKHKIAQVSIQIEIRKLGEPGANSETDYTKMSSIPPPPILENTTDHTIVDMSANTKNTVLTISDDGATANTVPAIPDDGTTTARKYLFWLKSIFLYICLFTTVIIGYVIIFTTVNTQYRTVCSLSFLGVMLMFIRRYSYDIICKK